MNNKEDWLRERKNYLGGSDIGAIVGACKKRTQLTVYYSKVSDTLDDLSNIDEQQAQSFEWGNRLESVVAQKFADVTGHKITESAGPIYHPEYPFLAANIDRFVYDETNNEKYVLECKTWCYSRKDDWGREYKEGDRVYTEKIPDMYKTQVAWYAAICDVPKVEIAVLIGNRDFRMYTYRRNREFEDALIKIGCKFWNDHVIPRIPPPAINNSDCSILYPKSQRDVTVATSDIADKIWLLKSTKDDEKKLLESIENLTVDIKNFMQDYEVLSDEEGNYLATWKNNAPKRYLDVKKLQQESPEVFAKYSKTIPGCRMFLIK